MNTLFSPRTAKYLQLSERLQQQIAGGEVAPNQQLPTEDELMQRFGISRGTVRKAIDVLERQGLVRREQGRGTFVNDPASGTLAGFVLSEPAREMQLQQRRPSTKVLAQEVVPAPARIAAELALAEGDEVIHIQRLWSADAQPIIFEERYLDLRLCPDLATEDVETQSIHWLLAHKYKLPLVRVTHTVEMREAGAEWAAMLHLQPTDPVFAVERVTFTRLDGALLPAVYYHAIYHGEEYQFRAQFNTLI